MLFYAVLCCFMLIFCCFLVAFLCCFLLFSTAFVFKLMDSAGDIGAHYRCIMPEGVAIHNKMKGDMASQLTTIGRVLKVSFS